jgi:hypothetical protein
MSSSRLTTSLEACLPMEVANPNHISFSFFLPPSVAPRFYLTTSCICLHI